jgi:predicted RNA polymerase sigma factor
VPDNPRAWLITVASRRLTDRWRSEDARRRREVEVFVREVSTVEIPGDDDTLDLLFLCCHPALTPPAQVALTLRAVGGLTTAEIARAFLVPEATMAQRISRSKARIKADGGQFHQPGPERLGAVLHVLYLVFNEGYVSTSGADLQRPDLTGEAIRLARQVHRARPDDGEVTGLLALMLLTDARRAARTGPDGRLISLAEQDRTTWDAGAIAEGVELVSTALARSALGPYQLQAAIAAVHAEAAHADDTDWAQIATLYDLLARLAPSPLVTLNHAIAVAMVLGPHAGLDLLAPLAADSRLQGNHRLPAVRGHLLELAGDRAAARVEYQRAAKLTTSTPEQRYLEAKAAALA